MNTLFELPTQNPQHPAKYTDVLLGTFVKMLAGRKRILDPFGGTGKVFLLQCWMPDAEIQAVEIEPEWVAIHPRTTLGNALHLEWPDGYFDAICTSPTYGNHMVDQSTGLSSSGTLYKTLKYRAMIGRKLHPDNSGALQWGEKYRDLHIRAWKEARRVLQPNGVFVLNIKNHLRNGQEQRVTEWHIDALQSLGFQLIEHVKLNVPSFHFGRGGEKRIEYESVIKFAAPAPAAGEQA